MCNGVDLNSDVMSELAQHPNIVGTKLTCGVYRLATDLGKTLPIPVTHPEPPPIRHGSSQSDDCRGSWLRQKRRARRVLRRRNSLLGILLALVLGLQMLATDLGKTLPIPVTHPEPPPIRHGSSQSDDPA
jgi:hypothetical protein